MCGGGEGGGGVRTRDSGDRFRFSGDIFEPLTEPMINNTLLDSTVGIQDKDDIRSCLYTPQS